MKLSNKEILLCYLVNKDVNIDEVFFDEFCKKYDDYINRSIHDYSYNGYKKMYLFYMRMYREYQQKIINENEV